MSYLAQVGADPGQSLSVALVQKGTSLQPDGTLAGDTSGINLFNGNPFDPSLVVVWFFDQTGATVAPTLAAPVVLDIPPYGGATLYTPFYQEMPAGFQGSALARVLDGGPVSAISNNVNYAVEGDGSAVFNLHVATPLQEVGAYALTLTPGEAINAVNTDHTVTATFMQDGAPVAGAVVIFTVTSGDPPDTVTTGAGITDANGEATFTYSSVEARDDTITACVDVDASGACDAGDLTATASKAWEQAVATTLALEPADATNPVNTNHTVTATVTDQFGNPVQGVTVLFTVDPGAGSTPSSTSGSDITDAAGQATFSYTSTTANTGGESDTITACADVDADATCDVGEPSDTATKTWQSP